MTATTRPISWIKAARKDFEDFPAPVQREANRALTVAAEGRMAENMKPLKGFDSGTMEIVTVGTLSGSFMPSRLEKTYG
jgi:phage-related protein